MKINTYLGFNGTCAEAFRFYEKALGGKIAFLMTHADSPMKDQTAPEWLDKVMHVRLEVGDQTIMGGDAPPGHFSKPQGFSVSIGVNEPAQAEKIFAALAEGAQVQMPLQETFWAQRFGMLIDKFGTPWMVNCEKPM